MAKRAVCVALDWTPNTNHIGLAVAVEEGYFSEAGLEVTLLSPHADGYKATPASRLADGTAQLAVAPSESVISWATWPAVTAGAEGAGAEASKPKIRAVAALLQRCEHAIVTRKSSGIDRPKLLDGKTYASYGARFEGRIVQEMIRRDGGKGEFRESTPPMLEIWDAFLKGDADATWIFMPWEGVLAEMAGVELNAFSPEDFLPYGHSPVLVASPDFLRDRPDDARAFLAAATRGYAFAAAHPAKAAAALKAYADRAVSSGAWPPLPAPLDAAMLERSAARIAPSLLTESGAWGVMDMGKWAAFVEFLDTAGLLTAKVQSRTPGEGRATLDELRAPGGGGERVPPPPMSELATNEFLP